MFRSTRYTHPFLLIIISSIAGGACDGDPLTIGKRASGGGGEGGSIPAGAAGLAAGDGGHAGSTPVGGGHSGTPDNGSGGTPDNGSGGTTDNGSGGTPGNASGGAPGNGSGGTPGNGSGATPGNGSGATTGNGSAGTGGEGGSSTGGSPSTGPCAGLEGEWSVRPTVSALEGEPGFSDILPSVGDEVEELGVIFSVEDQTCQVEWRPVWGRTGTAPLLPSGAELATPVLEDTETAWCGWDEWRIDQVVAVPGSAPMLRLSSTVTALADDIATSVGVTASGTLKPGLPALSLRGRASPSSDPLQCLQEATPETVSSVLPWSRIVLGTSQPVASLDEHLEATVDGAAVSLEWELPSDSPDADRLASAQFTDWDAIMGKELAVGVDAAPQEQVVFSIVELPFESAYVGDTLADLVTVGTRALETVDGSAVLRLSGTSCGQGVSAAGILDVSGKSAVWVDLEIVETGAPWYGSGLTVDVVHTDGSRQTATLVSAEETVPRRYSVQLDGAATVGVQVTANGGCQAETWWNPDIRIVGIGTN